MDHKS